MKCKKLKIFKSLIKKKKKKKLILKYKKKLYLKKNSGALGIKKKDIDGVCYNLLEDSQSFGTDENNMIFITGEKSIDLGTDNKLRLSFKILLESQKLENEQ